MKNQPNKVQKNFPGIDALSTDAMPGIIPAGLSQPHLKMKNHSHLAQAKNATVVGYSPTTRQPNSKVKGMFAPKIKA